MATLERHDVSPSVLTWARTTASIDLATAARRLKVPPERLVAWESGDNVKPPTIGQLRKMADVYQRPLAAFFLSEPIAQEQVPSLPDFRRPAARAETMPPSLQKAVIRVRRQQAFLRDIADETGIPDGERLAAFSLSRRDDAEAAGQALRTALGLNDIPAGVMSRPEEFLRAAVRSAERLFVYVGQVQNVPLGVMRGFSLGEGTFPMIVLNGGDQPRGKVFTLLHELAHVGLRTSGLCDFAEQPDADTERLCNRIAAEALMPAAAFLARAGHLTGEEADLGRLSALGNTFGCSGEAALLRMIDMGRATWEDHRRLRPEFERLYAMIRAERRAESSTHGPAPIFYQLKIRDLGRPFIRQVLRAHGENAASSRDVAQLLEVSYDKVPRLADEAGAQTA
jgi:Zn-dependent peptidase ImmA (M78 family)/transcriptional regulator with XRE-family HTH domain